MDSSIKFSGVEFSLVAAMGEGGVYKATTESGVWHLFREVAANGEPTYGGHLATPSGCLEAKGLSTGGVMSWMAMARAQAAEWSAQVRERAAADKTAYQASVEANWQACLFGFCTGVLCGGMAMAVKLAKAYAQPL